MQTFITDHNMYISANNLDRARLGKQRSESLQVADCLLEPSSKSYKKYRNKKIVKMWEGHEAYLLLVYTMSIFLAWTSKGYRNEKSQEHFDKLISILNKNKMWHNYKKPEWITDEFIETHRSKLISKKPEYYRPLFPETTEGLEYYWPIK